MIDGVNSTNSTTWWLKLLSQNNSRNIDSASTTATNSYDSYELSDDAMAYLTQSDDGKRANPLDQLVDDGTLTEEQAAAIDEALRSGTVGSTDNPLASLIEGGTITQEQADSVKEVLGPPPAQQQEQSQSLLASTLQSLVEDGTLTEEQADSVTQALTQKAPPPPPQTSSSDDSSDSTTNLDSLTAEEIYQLLAQGKITAAQANNALQKLEGQSSDSEQASDEAQNPLEALVTSGVITEDQENAIFSALRQSMDSVRATQAYSSFSAISS